MNNYFEYKTVKILIIGMSFILFLYGCNEQANKTKGIIDMDNNPTISESTVKKLRSIQNIKIMFAHHSVGKNILDGLNDIAMEAGVKINVASINNKIKMDTLKFVDFNPGKNTLPKTKVDGFVKKIEGLGADYNPDIAFMKFCYIDFSPETNVNELFNYYKDKIEKLKKGKPDIIFVHLTVPLVAELNTVKSKIKRILGMDARQKASNIKRNEFNKLINDSFFNEPIFDIARIESTRKDGSREQFTKNGKNYYRMLPEYTTDGGHLNKLGKYVLATELVNFLDKTINEKHITIK